MTLFSISVWAFVKLCEKTLLWQCGNDIEKGNELCITLRRINSFVHYIVQRSYMNEITYNSIKMKSSIN